MTERRSVLRWVLCTAALATSAIAASATAVSAADTVLIGAAQPNGNAAPELAVAVAPSASAASVELFVRESTGAAVTSLIIYAPPTDGVTLSFAAVPGEEASGELKTALAARQQLDVRVTVTLADFDGRDVPIYASTPSGVTLLTRLKITHPKPAALTIVGAKTGARTIESSGPRLDSFVTVETGDKAARSVMVRFTPLVDSATGTSVQLDKPVLDLKDLAANSESIVDLDAVLPVTGTFVTSMRISHDGITDPSVEITVVRKLLAPHVTFDVTQTSNSSFAFPAGRRKVSRVIVLTDSTGRPSVLSRPLFVKPSAKDATTSFEEIGKVTSVVIDPATQAGCESNPDGAIHLTGAGSCRVVIGVELPATAGQYDGIIRFDETAGPTVDVPVTVQLRLNIVVAIVVILAGLVIGLIVQSSIRDRRQRLNFQLAIAQTGAQLDLREASLPGGALDDRERQLADGLRLILSRINDDSDPYPTATAEVEELKARLTSVRKAIPSYVPLVMVRRAIRAAGDVMCDRFLPTVDEIAVLMTSPTLSDAEAGTLGTRITALAADLRSARAAVVADEIASVQAAAKNMLDPAMRAEVDAVLAAAHGFVSGPNGSPEAASERLLAARKLLAADGARVIEDFLDRKPMIVPDDAWQRLVVEVRAALSGLGSAAPLDAVRIVADADLLLLRGIVNATVDEVQRRIDALDKDAPAEKRTALGAILAKLADARTAIRQGKNVDAHAAYDAATAKTDDAKRAGLLGPNGQTSEFVSAPTVMIDSAASGPISAVAVPGAVPLPGAIVRQIQGIDRLAHWVTIVVGLLVGLTALYSGKPMWGTWMDIVTALLWGVGIKVAADTAGGYGGTQSTLAI